MTYLTDQDPLHCSVCSRSVAVVGSQQWIDDGGRIINLPVDQIPSIMAKLENEDFCLCESCYVNKQFPVRTIEELFEIHYQFALEYRDLRRFVEELNALQQALHYRRTANLLVAFAQAYNDLEDCNKARNYYQQALEIDPQHFIVLNNLQLLEQEVQQEICCRVEKKRR